MRRLALLLPVCLVAVACGSSGRLSHAQLVAKADAVCAKAHAAEAKLTNPRKPKDIVPHLNRLIAIAEQERLGLAALKPAKDDQKTFAALLDRLTKTVVLTRRVRDAAKANQPLRANVLIAAVVRSNKDAQSFAEGFGLKVCSASASG
jgi:hypothetical protein